MAYKMFLEKWILENAVEILSEYNFPITSILKSLFETENRET